MSNNKQETIEEAAERILSKEGIKQHPGGLETYLKGNVINAMVEIVKWQKQTLEERVKELAPGHSLENTLIAFANVGAEWQAEKTAYTEDQVKAAFNVGFNIGYSCQVSDIDRKESICEEWFEQFKKSNK
jgi:hypothetical protein